MLKKIPVQKLTLGMHLQAFCGAWLDHPFWRTKFVLTDPNDLELILGSSIKEVWIDVSKGLDADPGESDSAGEKARRRHDIRKDDRELRVARLVEGELGLGEALGHAVSPLRPVPALARCG